MNKTQFIKMMADAEELGQRITGDIADKLRIDNGAWEEESWASDSVESEEGEGSSDVDMDSLGEEEED